MPHSQGGGARPHRISSRHLTAALLWAAIATTAAPARASFVCDALGEAAGFAVLAEQSFLALPGPPKFDLPSNSPEIGRTCSRKSVLTVERVDGDLVALRVKGTATVFRRAPAGSASNQMFLGGTLVTGGGEVRLSGTETIRGGTDTAGSHPSLTSCQTAIADAAAASSSFAALPPTRTFGDVVAPSGWDSDTLVIDATGGSLQVLDFDSLHVEGAPPNCWLAGGGGGALRIYTDSGAEVIINAGKFSLGNCASIDLFGAERAVINVPGKGGPVKVGLEADLGYRVSLLAPQRTVVVTGGFGDPTVVEQVVGRRVVLEGSTNTYSGSCPNP